ncbi:hypothetical protein [Pseudomonas mosselii]|nr:hypothetical protein [Pseudomonas mosselii]MCU9532800.1 hypothetical protein [Pseudomonas mosselii]MCU9540212.1 hypothetical protein [Pseudomonas mosselii]WJR26785.1 hypothetical protein LU678_020735 [Pseudomonas mosselii]
MLWSKERAAAGLDGVLKVIEITKDAIPMLINADSKNYPLLSKLCLDDYGLYSGEQLDRLRLELKNMSRATNGMDGFFCSLDDLALEARVLGESVLFDPFRDLSSKKGTDLFFLL